MPPEFKDSLGVVALLISIGGSLYAWLTRQGKEAGERVIALDTKLDKAVKDHDAKIETANKDRDRKIDVLEDRIARVEGQIGTLPDRDQMHRVELEMERMRGSLNQLSTELRGSIETLGERLKPVAAMASRAHDVLLEDRK